MARIPETIGQSEFTNTPPDLYARPHNVDASPVARGLSQASETVMALIQEKQNIKNETAVLDAYAKATNAKNEYLFAPETGVYAGKGAEALQRASTFEGTTKKIGESHSGALDPEAKRKFDNMWKRSNLTDYEGLLKFQLGEAAQYKVNTGNAVVDTAVTSAVHSYKNPEVIKRSKTEILGAVVATSKGQSKEVQSELLMSAYSKLHKGIIYRLAAESPTEAEEYYKANREEITGEDHVQVTNFLKEHVFKASVYKQTERITSTGGPVREVYEAIAGQDPNEPRSVKTETIDPQTGKAVAPPPEGLNEAALRSAVTTHESSGRPGVVTKNKAFKNSPAEERSAVGLMQVTIETARTISRELKDGLMEGKSAKEVEALLKDPMLNVRYGTHELQKYGRKYGGDLEAMLIAYNAGPRNADKWLQSGRDYAVLPDRKQTEPYVRRVIGTYRRNLEDKGLEYPKSMNNLRQANVVPAATAQEQKTFRTEAAVPAGAVLNDDVLNGVATMWQDIPETLKPAISWADSGGDLLARVEDAFAKEWLLTNMEAYGVVAQDEEQAVRVTAGEGGKSYGLLVDGNEKSLTQQLAEADKITDLRTRDAVRTELAQRHNMEKMAEAQQENQVKRDIWAMALDGKEIPIELAKQVSPSYMSEVNSYIRKAATDKVQTDWGVWENLRLMTKDQLTEIPDAMVYRNKLADTEFKQFVDMIRDARGLAVSGDPLVSTMRTRTQIVKDTLGKTYKNNPEATRMFNTALDQEVLDFHRTTGKVPNAVETQEIVDRLVLRGDILRRTPRGGTSSIDGAIFDLKPGDFLASPVVDTEDQIPITFRQNMDTQASKKFGRALTAAEKTYVYSAAIAATRGAYIDTPESLKKVLLKQGYPIDRINSVFSKLSIMLTGIE